MKIKKFDINKAYYKIANCIKTCTTKEHCNAVSKMITLYQDYIPYSNRPIELASELQRKRNSLNLSI